MPNVAFGTRSEDCKTIQNQNRGPMLLPLPRKRMPGERYSGRTGRVIGGRTQPERKKLLWEGLGQNQNRGPMLLPLPRKTRPGERYCGRTGWLIGRTQPERKKPLEGEDSLKGRSCSRNQKKRLQDDPKPEPGPNAFAIATQKNAWRTLLWEDRAGHWRANTA